jgi:hypothetical protein
MFVAPVEIDHALTDPLVNDLVVQIASVHTSEERGGISIENGSVSIFHVGLNILEDD